MNTDSIDNEQLYKVRSVRACIKSATDMMITNPLTILRRTWLPTLVISVITSLSILLPKLCFQSQPSTETTSSMIPLLAFYAISLVAFITAATWWVAAVFSLLTGVKAKDGVRRVLYLVLAILGLYIFLAICIAVAYILPMLGSKASMTHPTIVSPLASLCITAVGIIFILPISYSCTKYLVEPQQKLMSIIGKSYATGWRHWGFLFLTALLGAMISAVIIVVTGIPEMVLETAKNANDMGMMMGDSNGLPSAFTFLQILITIICYFIWYYVYCWVSFVNYYVYGSIEAKENAKKEVATMTDNTSDDNMGIRRSRTTSERQPRAAFTKGPEIEDIQ